MSIRKIDNPEQVYTHEGLTVISDGRTVRVEPELPESPYDTPSLAEIRRSVNGRSILVISESGLHGDIYRYGNHGDYWELVGETCGYA